MIYSNYEGGVLNIDVDVDIPNLKIGISTYEPVTVNFSGAFVGNITGVIFAGFNEPIAITGVPAALVTVYAAEVGDVAISPYLSEYEILGIPIANCMVGAEGCTSFATGGSNSSPQIVQFFLAEFGIGSSFYAHRTSYTAFPPAGFDVSNGGNCCLDDPLGDPNPIYVGGTVYNFLPDTLLLCDDELLLDISFYETLWGTTTWSTGETGPDIVVNEPGVYSFTMWDYCHYDPANLLTDTVWVIPCFTEIDTAICSGETYILPDGTSVTDSGTYSVTLTAADGTDSTVVTYLDVLPVYTLFLSATICDAEMYTLPDGSTTSLPGVYDFLFTSAGGCDSLVTISLTAAPAYAQFVSVSICSGESYVLPDGALVTAAGTYVNTFTTAAGCDSVISTTLSVLPEYTTSVSATICEGSSYILPDGTAAEVGGIYTVSLSTVAGCDSTVVTTLSVVSEFDITVTASICDGEVYTLPDGSLTVLSGTYTFNFISAGGCDSAVTVDLDVTPVYAISTAVSICDGDTYILPDGVAANVAGTYVSNLYTADGCDSVITTFVLVNPVYTFFKDTVVCAGEEVMLPDGSIVNTPGVYALSFSTTAGCDSVYFYDVSNFPEVVIDFSLPDIWCFESGVIELDAAPDGGSFSGAGVSGLQFDPAETGAGSTSITYLYTDLNGCVITATEDLVIELNFADAGPDTTIFDSGVAELAGITGGSYQWFPPDGLTCTDCPVTFSETDITTTYYLSSVSDNGCLAFDSVTVFVNPSNEAVFIPNTFTPNGDGANDVFALLGPGVARIVQAAVYDRWGERIWFTEDIIPADTNASWDGYYGNKPADQGVYAYLMEVEFFSGRRQQFSGNITLIR